MKKSLSVFLAAAVMLTSAGAPVLAGTDAVYAAATSSAAASATSAASMTFTGTEIKLSLDQAIERMSKTGPAYEAVKLTKDGNDAAAKGQFETISAIKDARDLYKSLSPEMKEAAGTVPSLNSLTGKQATLAKDFYKKYTPVAYEAGMNGIKYQTIQAYYGLLMSNESYKIAKESTQIKKTLYDNTKKKYNLGVVSKMDVLQAENSYLSAKQDEEEALTSLNTVKMQTNMALGYDVMQKLTLTDTLKMVEAPKTNLGAAINSALEKRADIMQAKYNMDNALLSFNSVSAYPKSSATYLGAQATYNGQKLTYDTKLTSVEIEVRTAYMQLQDLKNAVTVAQSTYNNAKEGARLTQLQYNAGMCTLTDLETAQNSAQAAKLGVSSAINSYDLAVYNFEFITGAGTM